MKKKPFSVIIAIILIVWLPLSMWLYRALGHRALQSYVAELRARGEKVTLKELYGSISTLAPSGGSLARLTNAVQILGEPPGGTTNVEAMQFVAAGRARIAWKQNAPRWISRAGGTNGTWVALSDRLKQMTGPLTELREAGMRPDAKVGIRTLWFAESPTPFRAVRTAGAWLTCAALSDLREDRNADALENIQSICGLANLHRDEYVLASQMLRVAVGGVGLRLTWEAVQKSGWDKPQLLALQHCWESIDFLEVLERGMEGERCEATEILKMLSESNWSWEAISNGVPRSAKPRGEEFATQRIMRFGLRTISERDLLLMLRETQTEVELLRSLRGNRPWSEVERSLRQLSDRIERLSTSPRRYLYLFTLIGMPNMTRAFRTAVRTETERRLAITAIALRRFELENGRCAPALVALVPGYLPAVLKDCMSGKDLRYRVNGDCAFSLYSVGEDGKDDGGDATPAKQDADPGLWEGRDAVWPLAMADEHAQAVVVDKPRGH